MKITIRFDALKKLGHKAGNAAFSAAETAAAAAEGLRDRAEEYLQRLRLEQAIADLEEETALQLRCIGELVYATHRGTPADSDDIQEILEYVDSLQEEIDAHRQQLKAMGGALLCAACGAENQAGSVYCERCGQPLVRR